MKNKQHPMLIWKESIYNNDFHCDACGAQLFDIERDTPTKNLAFEQVAPGQPLPARCSCAKCGNPAAVAQSYEGDAKPGLHGELRSSNSREKINVSMYAIGIDAGETFIWVTQKQEEFREVCQKAKVKAFHADPQGRFHAFLYLHPKARDKAYNILRQHFETVFSIAEPVMVDVSQLKSQGGQEG